MTTFEDQARSVFLAALDRAPEQWPAFLDEACAANAELRARVGQLLHAHHALGSIHGGAGAPAAAERAAEVSPAEGPGTVLGPYQLLEQIGEGGMGTVWMAQQTKPVKRLVALKLVKAGMDTRQVIARFEAEGQALALMDHPNIARVLDAGTSDAGRPYFVMDLVKGVPITRYCDEQRLTPRQRLELFLPVCQAVQHAHQKGVIHRDLKPSNVLVALYDGQPVPKVIDFGVAKAAGQQLTEKTLVTGFGAIVGTLEYMSPEQAQLNNLDIDTRSDIYSLGVVLYELLTGSPPFTCQESEKGGILEMLRLIRDQEPTKPSAKLSTADGLPTLAANRGTEPAKLARLVRGELDWIAMKALEKDRDRRYQTANGLALDVQRYLADEPVLACPPSAWYRLRKFARRNKGRLAVAAGVFLAATVVAATIGWGVWAETARLATVAGQVGDSLSAARVLLDENELPAARASLARAGAQLGNDGPALADLAARVEATEAALVRFQQFLDLIDRAHQAETASLHRASFVADRPPGGARGSGVATTWGERMAAAVPFVLEALRRYDVLERDAWTSTLEGSLLGRSQVEQIRRAAYEELLWLADDLLRRHQGHESERKLSRQEAVRAALIYLGKAESAQRPTQAFFVLRARCRSALGGEAAAQADRELALKTPATIALDHFLQGQAAYNAKQLTEAVRAFEAALRLEPTHYWSMMRLGSCLLELGRGPGDFSEAARVFTGCILKRPDHADAYYRRAIVYHRLGRYEDCLADSSRVIELDPKHGPGWNCRGMAFLELGMLDKGLADCIRATELDPKHAEAWHNRGAAHAELGRPDKAVADLTRAIALGGKRAPASSWFSRGKAYDNLGRPAKAVENYSRVIELDPKHVHAWNNRGCAYYKLEQFAMAVEDCSRAIELDPKYATAWLNRGLAYYKLNQKNKAAADFTRATELNPKSAFAWSNRAACSLALGQPERALAESTTATELDARLALAWRNRGAAHTQLGRLDKAVADFSRVIDLAANDPKLLASYPWLLASALLRRAEVHQGLANYEQARNDYQSFLKREPTNAAAHNALAWLLATCPDAKVRDPDQAVELATKAVGLAPEEGAYRMTLGAAHYRAGDYKAALAAFDMALKLRRAREPPEALFLAMTHQKLGNHKQARTEHARVVGWLDKNKWFPANNKIGAEILRSLRAEAEEVLELKKP
jgi:tetratricopeptide (TPR) repeat protein